MTSNESKNKQSTVKIFKVHPNGNITGSRNATPGDTIIVEYSSRSNHYAGKVYANHNGSNGSNQLVGSAEITIGMSYPILAGAALPGNMTTNYMITTTLPALRRASGPGPAGQGSAPTGELAKTGGNNGDLYVGSGG
jgi:hypothetical protein